MNENLLIGLFITLFAFILATISSCIVAYINLVRDNGSINGRLTKLETILAMFGEAAAKALHCPTTPDIDYYLDKYLNREYELTVEEWQELSDICENIENDLSKTKGERMCAGMIKATCYHKLFKPPFKFKAHNEDTVI